MDNTSYSEGQTKIPCDYCEEQVALARYVAHCKKFHSVSDLDERSRRKCYKCGIKVHIIAEKFHDKIYHPVNPKAFTGRAEPLKIVEHNKNLTKVQCDYCHLKITFSTYKLHVKNKHPEIAYTELVKCKKCGCKVPKISFKFHEEIFHNANKLKLAQISTNSLFKPKLKVPCSQCDVKVRPHVMFWHMKTVHGGGKTDQQSVTATERNSDEQANEPRPNTGSDISDIEGKVMGIEEEDGIVNTGVEG